MSGFEVRWPKPNLTYNWMVKSGLFPKYKVRHKFCKNIHLSLWRQGHNVVAHGGRSRQEWAHTLNVAGHGVRGLTPGVGVALS
jgi:hypothetical protein